MSKMIFAPGEAMSGQIGGLAQQMDKNKGGQQNQQGYHIWEGPIQEA